MILAFHLGDLSRVPFVPADQQLRCSIDPLCRSGKADPDAHHHQEQALDDENVPADAANPVYSEKI